MKIIIECATWAEGMRMFKLICPKRRNACKHRVKYKVDSVSFPFKKSKKV